MTHTHSRTAPRRPSWLPSCFALALVCLTARASAAEPYVFSHESVMGTSMELRVWADHSDAARDAEARVLGEIDRLSAILSGYDPNSELSRWSRAKGRSQAVSAPLREMLQAADVWRERSAGAFDPRVEVLSKLWAESAAQGREPSADETRRARESLARPAWRLDAASRTAEPLGDAAISFNAIAKGYILEQACDAAMKSGRGVRGLVLNVGGDLRAMGESDGSVGVVDPLADSESSPPLTVIKVHDRAVASSGRSQRGFSINGRWYSHIFDPRTGRPVETVAGATVVAPRSADADALATICNVLTPEESVRLVDATADAACLIVLADGRTGPVRTHRLPTRSPPKPSRPPPNPGNRISSWPSISRSTIRPTRAVATVGRTSRSGSRTRRGVRSAT
jgi:FAD:protein FMN transferase